MYALNWSYSAVFACIATLTTSKGLTIMASVTPAPSPAKEYVYTNSEYNNSQYM